MPKPALSLVSHFLAPEVVGFMNQAYPHMDMPSDALLALWSKAAATVTQPVPNAGQPELLPVPEELLERTAVVTQQLAYQALLPEQPRIQVVEIDPLLSYQINVELDRVDDFRKVLPTPVTMDTAFDLCLPVESHPNHVSVAPEQNAITMSSTNGNLRIMGWVVANPNETPAPGTGRLIGFLTGFGSPFTIVAHVEGRYVLKNGYHRAVALRQAGMTHMPAVIVEGELGNLYQPGPGFFNPPVLTRPNPPVIGHFLTSAVSVMVPSVMKVVRIEAKEFTIPLDPATNFVAPTGSEPVNLPPEAVAD